jgi:hypothetical protein
MDMNARKFRAKSRNALWGMCFDGCLQSALMSLPGKRCSAAEVAVGQSVQQRSYQARAAWASLILSGET